jgi:hypothetical protein
MRRICTALLASVVGCGPAEPIGAPDPVTALERVRATIHEAGRNDLSGNNEPARVAWRRAHDEWEAVVEPELRRRVSPSEVAEIELRFGLFRAAIERTGSTGRVEAIALEEALESLVPTLTPPTPESEGPAASPDVAPAASPDVAPATSP